MTVDKLDPTTNKVVVVDEHVDQDGPPSTANELRGRRYFVNREHVLLMPRPEDAPNIKHEIGSNVMAMYPDTTTFYPATVTESGIMEGERCCMVQVRAGRVGRVRRRPARLLELLPRAQYKRSLLPFLLLSLSLRSKFIDDEDETGVIPSRLVPNRFITVR